MSTKFFNTPIYKTRRGEKERLFFFSHCLSFFAIRGTQKPGNAGTRHNQELTLPGETLFKG